MKTLKLYHLIGITLLAANLMACGDKKETTARVSALSGPYGSHGNYEVKFPDANSDSLIDFSELQEGQYDLEGVRTRFIYGSRNAEYLAGFDLDLESAPSKRYCFPNAQAVKLQKSWLRGLSSQFNIPSQGIVVESEVVEWSHRYLSLMVLSTEKGEKCRTDITLDDGDRPGTQSIEFLLNNPLADVTDKVLEINVQGNRILVAAQRAGEDRIAIYMMTQRSGRETLHAFLMKRIDLQEDYRAPAVASFTAPVLEPEETEIPDELRIRLGEEEQEFAQVEIGRAAVRNSAGQVLQLNTTEEAVEYASRNGYDTRATEDMWQVSAKTGGVLSFASNKEELSGSILDHLGHMKNRMNANRGNLDLAFVLDYSGSMSDDIQSVIDSLEDITRSLDRVVDSWRTARVAIVTFGQPGRELVNLNFTTDMNQVLAKLQELREGFSSGNHSVDPGEACYHGIHCSATQLNWSAENRMSLVITDEPSYEARTNDQAKIDTALKAMKSNGIEGMIYTIITSR